MASGAFARSFVVKSPARHLELVGRVDTESLELAQKIEKLSRMSNKPITMLINSPGGSVGIGMAIIDAMTVAKKRGVRFYCLTGVLAASMGFNILAECDFRYALPNAKLLFHPVSISTQRSRVQELINDLTQLSNLEKRVMEGLMKKLHLRWRDFHMHYFSETFWAAEELNAHTNSKFLYIVKHVKVPGEKLFEYKKPQPAFPFFGEGNTEMSTADRIIQRFERGV